MNAEDTYPELLEDLATHAELSLVAHGVDRERAQVAARAVAERVREHWGGQLVYIPKGRAFETQRRYTEIWAKFTGTNHTELAREFDITEKQVYKVIQIMRAAQQAKYQGQLFVEKGASE